MESMVNIKQLFGGIYNGKKVLITGNTGFKGSWLSVWLQMLGADVYGYSLKIETNPNHFELLQTNIHWQEGNINDAEKLQNYIAQIQPDVVFHLAAQALVRDSYTDPVNTYTTNLLGTLNVLEACRKTSSVRAIVNVTTDKCYENKEWVWSYRENDPLGGYDPYSASKACSEIMTSSYRNSFLNITEYGISHHILLASARAGNVIGGGDWAKDRLIPDLVRAAAKNETVCIRNPLATRPWQHVLEPLSGYLMLGWRLLEGKKEFAESWNFGPDIHSNLTVGNIVTKSRTVWDAIHEEFHPDTSQYHEANLLMLDCTKANKQLHWQPVWGIEQTIEKTIHWYKLFYNCSEIITTQDIEEYIIQAKQKNILWTQQIQH